MTAQIPIEPDSYLDDTFASSPLTTRAPHGHFPTPERESREIYQLVSDELMLDGVARMNLATFCTTWVEPEVRQPTTIAPSRNTSWNAITCCGQLGSTSATRSPGITPRSRSPFAAWMIRSSSSL